MLAACVAVASFSAAAGERRVALVIGNSAYQNVDRLGNPAGDATAIAELLQTAHFDVVTARLDLGVTGFRRTLREFADVARNADMAVFYFAGHGLEMAGMNYLVPVDARLASDFDLEDETVTLERVLRVVEPARRLSLVILDACRDSPFARKMRRVRADAFDRAWSGRGRAVDAEHADRLRRQGGLARRGRNRAAQPVHHRNSEESGRAGTRRAVGLQARA